MINIYVPQPSEPQLKPCITVIGVGGAGGNAVNNMIADNLQGVDFVVANTDAQALSFARTERRIQLGANTTQGLGAGAKPEVGRAAAEESVDKIAEQIQDANMVFITAGMGGGTGTGAAPVIARTAREMGVLTVGVVTKPFQFEGVHRMRLSESGIEELSQVVDTLIIIPNQNLFRVANEKTTFADAFRMADDVLNAGVRSITDLMIMPGLINLDFADVRTVMSDMGRAMMGTGEASGDRRALEAAEAAIANPLLEDTCMKGAKGVLINITGGPDITLFEVDEAANRIRDEVEGEAHIIFGSCFDPDLEGKMRVSVVSTGIAGATSAQQPFSPTTPHQTGAQQVETVSPQAPPRSADAAPQTPPARMTQHQAPQQQTSRSHLGAPPPPQEARPPRQMPRVPVKTSPGIERPQPMDQPPQQMELPKPHKPADAFIPTPAMERTEQSLPKNAPTPPPPVHNARPNTNDRTVMAHHRAEQSRPSSTPLRPRIEPSHENRNTSFLKGLAARLTRDTHPADHHSDNQRRDSATMQDPTPTADRPATPSQQEEDELAIPAFLRRQAN